MQMNIILVDESNVAENVIDIYLRSQSNQMRHIY